MFNSILNKAFNVTGNATDTMTQSEFMERYMSITKGIKIYSQYASPQEYGNFKLFIKKVHHIEASGKKRLFTGIKNSEYNIEDMQVSKSPYITQNVQGF